MESNENWSWDLFVSHNRRQKPWVRSFVRQCRETGLRVFFDEDSIGPGEEVVAGIERGLVGSKHIVIIISPESIVAEWVVFETAISIGFDPTGSKRKVIPIMIENTPLENIRPAVKRLNFVDLTKSTTRREQYTKLFEFFGVKQAPPIPRVKTTGQLNRPKQKAFTSEPQITQKAFSSPALVLETGAMSWESSYYIERKNDEKVAEQLNSPEPTVTIRGYRKSGKSSLLNRLHHSARRDGVQCCYVDFQGMGGSLIQNPGQLFEQIAHIIVEGLGIKSSPENYWSSRLSPETNLTRFVEKGVLHVVNKPVQLLFDEVDMLLRTSAGLAFFSTLRSWHNLRATDHTGVWKKLRFAIAHVSDPALWIPSTDQSPFNVGLPIELEDFTLDQMADLNERYGSPLNSISKLEELFDLIGGHPYLARRSLHILASSDLSFSVFMESASSPDGPLGNYLKLYSSQIIGDKELLDAFLDILNNSICRGNNQFDQLWAIGLVTSHTRNIVNLRCKLYEDYFRSVLL